MYKVLSGQMENGNSSGSISAYTEFRRCAGTAGSKLVTLDGLPDLTSCDE